MKLLTTGVINIAKSRGVIETKDNLFQGIGIDSYIDKLVEFDLGGVSVNSRKEGEKILP